MKNWQAYDLIEPIDDATRIEAMLAQVCAILASAHGEDDYKPSDFSPDWDKRIEKIKGQKADEMKSELEQIVRAFGGEIRHKK